MDTQFLIADDSDGKIVMLEMLIKKSGYTGEVIIAKTTDQAKEMIDTHPNVSYGFIDYYIPPENGPSVISYLRSKKPDAKIALVTSSNNNGLDEEAREAGSNDFVCTSFEEDIVVDNINNLLLKWLP